MDRDLLPITRPWVKSFFEAASVVLPGLALLGVAAVFFWARLSPVATGMVALMAIYNVVLFAVLPEHHHSGILVLPMCILGAYGIVSSVSSAYRSPHWKIGSMALLGIAAVWGVACAGGYFWSLHQRAEQIAAIRRITADAVIDPTVQLQPQSMSVTRDSNSSPDRAGYLLEIETGATPGALRCHFTRAVQRGWQKVGWTYESEHRLQPGRRQFFFFSSFEGRLVEPYEYATTVKVDGDARIVSVRRADLSNWKDVQVSTVFYDGEHSPGSPVVGHPSEKAIYALQ
jgi:hypothetical protein